MHPMTSSRAWAPGLSCADDPAALLQAALKAGLAEVKHPGHPYYFMIPGGQVFTIAPTSSTRRVRTFPFREAMHILCKLLNARRIEPRALRHRWVISEWSCLDRKPGAVQERARTLRIPGKPAGMARDVQWGY